METPWQIAIDTQIRSSRNNLKKKRIMRNMPIWRSYKHIFLWLNMFHAPIAVISHEQLPSVVWNMSSGMGNRW